MKRILAATLVVAFVVVAIAAPAMAGDKAVRHAFGKMITAQCTAFYALPDQEASPYHGQKMTYGKLWRVVKKETSHAGVKPSAKRFVKSGQLGEHCPITTSD